MQIAVAQGAKVTGVCSGRNSDMVRELGATNVVDYAKDDFVTTRDRFDLIIDIVGNRSLAEMRSLLTPKGRYVLVGVASAGKWFGMGRLVRAALTSPFVSHTLKPMLATRNQSDLEAVRKMANGGELAPVIERTYPFEQSPDAIRHVQSGHARGKVVVTV